MMNKKGFTLIEVMVGLVILAMIAFMVWQISSGTIDSKDRVERRDVIYQMARIAMQRMVNDLNMAFLVANKDFLGTTPEGANITTAFIGRDNGNLDSVSLNSFSHWRMFRDARESDQSEVGYYVEQDPEDRQIQRLMRRESAGIDNKVEEGGVSYSVAEGISEFKLEYYDGRNEDWTDNWNSEEVDFKDKLPKAVKITLSFPDPEDEESKITFETIAMIELWRFPVEF